MGASLGPKEKSASLMGGKREPELGARVGSAEMTEQVAAGVGVFGMMVGVAVVAGVVSCVWDEHAPSIKRLANDKNEITRMRFI